MKNWRKYWFTVNGFETETVYNEATIENVFLPLLRGLTRMQREKQERLIVYVAAPPAVGKTTLCLFLEYLSRQTADMTEVQVIGLDGFHYHSDYINTHHAVVFGREVPMREVKGCPETYDMEKLMEKLRKIRHENILWPVYDRTFHDVAEDAVEVTKDIVLIEGNWLLLKEEPWASMRELADYTVSILAEEADLKERLIGRKQKGGMTREEAAAWYESSDSVNVRRVLESSVDGDLILMAESDNDYTGVSGKI